MVNIARFRLISGESDCCNISWWETERGRQHSVVCQCQALMLSVKATRVWWYGLTIILWKALIRRCVAALKTRISYSSERNVFLNENCAILFWNGFRITSHLSMRVQRCSKGKSVRILGALAGSPSVAWCQLQGREAPVKGVGAW
jgi:hypothetical protein